MLHHRLPGVATGPARPLGPPALFVGGAMTPAAYLRLRRAAAGLSVRDAAQAVVDAWAATKQPGVITPGQMRDQVRGWIELLETPGYTAKSDHVIRPLLAAFPLDLAVYAQLRDEPADRHPRICRGCGCSQNDACRNDEHGLGCGWAGDDLCTACVPAELAAEARLERVQ